MKDNTISAKKHSVNDVLNRAGKGLMRYAALWFILLLISVYGFVAFRILSAHDAQPSDADIAAQLEATPTPHIDPNAVSQLQSLQDNSVNVKTLFDQARSNPFQE